MVAPKMMSTVDAASTHPANHIFGGVRSNLEPLFALFPGHFHPVPGNLLPQQPLEPLVLVKIVLTFGDGKSVRFGDSIEHTPHTGQGVPFGRFQCVFRCGRLYLTHPPMLAAVQIALLFLLIQVILEVTLEQHLIDLTDKLIVNLSELGGELIEQHHIITIIFTRFLE
uniref:Uncharacterized protein n=1 Tax=Anopheles culicifacies TaxID=139723 RepID=A0A182M7I0_9DIPT